MYMDIIPRLIDTRGAGDLGPPKESESRCTMRKKLAFLRTWLKMTCNKMATIGRKIWLEGGLLDHAEDLARSSGYMCFRRIVPPEPRSQSYSPETLHH